MSLFRTIDRYTDYLLAPHWMNGYPKIIWHVLLWKSLNTWI